MATLKDHQQAMVDLLASGSGIPASASRLAHAMHDVLCHLTEVKPITLDVKSVIRAVEANSPGLNDKALAGDIEACRPKATPAERRVKELENTVKQLRASNAKLKEERDSYKTIAETHAGWIRKLEGTEQAGCRKGDTQVCEHEHTSVRLDNSVSCDSCGAVL